MVTAIRWIFAALLSASLVIWYGDPASTTPRDKPEQPPRDKQMSTMGRAAARVRAAIADRVAGVPTKDLGAAGICVNEPDCEGDDDLFEGPSSTQSETSIAVDGTGQHIVIGFNDFRGFSNNPVSISGFRYSDDGGQTFVDGGQLPSPGTDTIGTTKLPQVFGDPDVKYAGGCTFLYSSIIVKKFSATQAAQTINIHH